ncbi:hypothetical protein D3C71_2195500 [compost metagenome]
MHIFRVGLQGLEDCGLNLIGDVIRHPAEKLHSDLISGSRCSDEQISASIVAELEVNVTTGVGGILSQWRIADR